MYVQRPSVKMRQARHAPNNVLGEHAGSYHIFVSHTHTLCIDCLQYITGLHTITMVRLEKKHAVVVENSIIVENFPGQ